MFFVRRIRAFSDGLIWVLSAPLGVFLLMEGNTSKAIIGATFALGLIGAGFNFALGLMSGVYRGRFKYGTIDELAVLFPSVLIASVTLRFIRRAVIDSGLPTGAAAATGMIAMMGMLGLRMLSLFVKHWNQTHRQGSRTLILGDGDATEVLIKLMLAQSDSPYLPVGIICAPGQHTRKARLGRVRILGELEDLEAIAYRTRAETLIAGNGLDGEQLKGLDFRASRLGLVLKVLPSLRQLSEEGMHLNDITEVSDEEVLGRRMIQADEGDRSSILEMLAGKRVIITGAGGSIGSELARQVSSYQPEFVGLLDRDESALHAVHLSIFGEALMDSDDILLADIRDEDRITQLFLDHKPDVVFHAAALKHMPALEHAPTEAYKTNVVGTLNVLRASERAGVPLLVNVSTDKAASPTSILGHSKRVAERLTAGFAERGNYISVRFGNVLGSRGSVLHTFRAQIAQGGPVTVTHPEVTRYFMTVSEAVHLVLKAASIGSSGETLILDMGQPVRIDDVARHLIAKSGKDIEIVYTGIREGEKLHEVLVGEGEGEGGEHPLHPLVTHVKVGPLPQHDILDRLLPRTEAEAAATLRSMSVDKPVTEAAGVPEQVSAGSDQDSLSLA